VADARPFHWEYEPAEVPRERYIVTGGVALEGTVQVSGAKNAALKLLAAATLTGERCRFTNMPEIEDVRVMAETLSDLGVVVDHPAPNVYEVSAGDVARFVRDHADDLIRVFRAHQEAGRHEDVLATGDESVEYAIVHEVDVQRVGIETCRIEQRYGISADGAFDFRIADKALCRGRAGRCGQSRREDGSESDDAKEPRLGQRQRSEISHPFKD